MHRCIVLLKVALPVGLAISGVSWSKKLSKAFESAVERRIIKIYRMVLPDVSRNDKAAACGKSAA